MCVKHSMATCNAVDWSNRLLSNHIGVDRLGNTAIAGGTVGIHIAGGGSNKFTDNVGWVDGR